MTALAGPNSNEIPRWIRAAHHLVLHGHPDQKEAYEISELWASYVSDQYADRSLSRASLMLSVIGSALTHVFWRLRYGPSTPVSAGILFAGVGAAATMFALTDSYGFFNSYLGPGAVGMVYHGWLVARYLGKVPPAKALIVAALAIPALISAGLHYWNEHEIASDYLVVAATATGIISIVFLVAYSASNSESSALGQVYVYALIASLGLLSIANAHGALVYTSPDLIRASIAAFGVEAALTLWLLRNAKSLYLSNETQDLSNQRQIERNQSHEMKVKSG